MKQSQSGWASGLGLMRERVIIEQKEQAPDEAGGSTSTWVVVATVWASIQLCGTPKLQMSDERLIARMLWQIQIRRRRDVYPGMRFRAASADGDRERTYPILAVSEDVMQRRFLKCICEEQY